MRHTLLPLNERKALRSEYRVRLMIIILFMFSLAGVIGIGALFPAYVRALSEEKVQIDVANKLKAAQKIQGITAMEDELKSDQRVLITLPKSGGARISAVAQSIVGLRQSIKLNSFNFTQPGNATSTVTVFMQGFAPTRNDLLSFKTRLETTLPGAVVDLPISELAKSTDIQFSIKVTYKLP